MTIPTNTGYSLIDLETRITESLPVIVTLLYFDSKHTLDYSELQYNCLE